MKLVRFGVSMEEELLNQFDTSIDRKGYGNRSEALRDLVRRCLIEREQEDPSAQAIGVISFVYDHEKREIARQLTQLGHSHMSDVISSLHVHLDTHNCLEVIVARGKIKDIQELSDQILSNKGVMNGELTLFPQPKA